jgi:iron complex outermembrane receptor protein
LATWRRALNGKDDIQVHTYFDRTSLLGPQVGETRNTWDVDFMHHFTGGTRQDLRWGLGARVSPSEIIQTVPTLDVSPHQETLNTYSVFAQDEVAIVRERLWLTVGAKFEHNSYTGWETQPSTRLLWAMSRNQSIWAAASGAVRTPSQLEEGFQLSGFLAPTPPTFVRITGNPNFASERLAGYEAGYRGALTDRFYIDVSAYINHHDNLESFGAPSVTVETSPSPAHLLLVFPYANGVTGTSRGIEIAPDWKPTRWWQLKGSYSYDHIDLENTPGNPDTSAVYTYEGSTPRHQASIQSQLSLPRTWQVDSVIRYVSALPIRTIPAYATVDLRIGREIGDHLTCAVVGQNLADAHHEEFAHDPGPPVALRRSVYAVMTWKR